MPPFGNEKGKETDLAFPSFTFSLWGTVTNAATPVATVTATVDTVTVDTATVVTAMVDTAMVDIANTDITLQIAQRRTRNGRARAREADTRTPEHTSL